MSLFIYIRALVFFLLIIFLSTKASAEKERIYGSSSIGIIFRSPIQLKLPFESPKSFVSREYWSNDGNVWVLTASIKNRNNASEGEILKLLAKFFFRAKWNDLKSKKIEIWNSLQGKVLIEDEPYLLKVKYILKDGFFHIIFIFCSPHLPIILKKIDESVIFNPNFQKY